jgi:hypothetical protein
MPVDISIYLHGFFFSEIQGDQLVIASPPHKMHNFGYWDHQQNDLKPYPVYPNTFSWIPALRQGQQDTFPTDVLRFTRSDLSMPKGEWFISAPGDQYAFYVKLPLPADIISVRPGGNLSEIGMDLKGKVATSIKKQLPGSPNLSLITCLQYVANGPIGFTDISFFGEHCAPPDMVMLNILFRDAQRVLPRFDLTLLKLNPGPKLPGPGGDENLMKLCEAGTKLKHNPCPPCVPTIAQQADAPAPLIRTANCPQFGIVQG